MYAEFVTYFDFLEKKREIIKIPPTSAEIPDQVPYLLVGGGTASFSAFRAIKSADPKAKVSMYYFLALILSKTNQIF